MTAEAELTGRSIATVAEMWLEDARQGRASVDSQLGGSKAASTLRQMAGLARLVEAHVGDPDTSKAAQYALMQGWSLLTRTTLKQILPTPKQLAVTKAKELVFQSYIDAFAKLHKLIDPRLAVEYENDSRLEYEAALESISDSGFSDGDRLAALLAELNERGEFPKGELAQESLHDARRELKAEDEKMFSNPLRIVNTIFQIWKPSGPLTDAIANIVVAGAKLDEAIQSAEHEDEVSTESGRQFIATMWGLAEAKGIAFEANVYGLSFPYHHWSLDE